MIRNTQGGTVKAQLNADGTLSLITTQPLTEPMRLVFTPAVWAEVIAMMTAAAARPIVEAPAPFWSAPARTPLFPASGAGDDYFAPEDLKT